MNLEVKKKKKEEQEKILQESPEGSFSLELLKTELEEKINRETKDYLENDSTKIHQIIKSVNMENSPLVEEVEKELNVPEALNDLNQKVGKLKIDTLLNLNKSLGLFLSKRPSLNNLCGVVGFGANKFEKRVLDIEKKNRVKDEEIIARDIFYKYKDTLQERNILPEKNSVPKTFSSEKIESLSSLFAGKSKEEIEEIFLQKIDSGSLIKPLMTYFYFYYKNHVDKKDKIPETLLEIIEKNANMYNDKSGFVNKEKKYIATTLFTVLLKGDPAQKKLGLALLKKNISLLEETVCFPYPNTSHFSINILSQEGDPELKSVIRSWLEKIFITGQVDQSYAFCFEKLFEKDKESFKKFILLFLTKQNLPAEEVWKAWKIGSNNFSHSLCNLAKIESDSPGSAKELHSRFNISNFGRYPSEVLIDQYKRRNEDIPYGIIIYPVGDHNGSFELSTQTIQKFFNDLKNSKYGMRIVEVGGKFGLAKNLIKLDQKYGLKNKISFRVIAGHGKKNHIQFGALTLKNFFNNKNILLKKEDLSSPAGQKIDSFFEKGAPTVLLSCSTGEEGGIGQEISNKYDTDVVAPKKPFTHEDLHVSFEDDGKIKLDVTYYGGNNLRKKYSKGYLEK